MFNSEKSKLALILLLLFVFTIIGFGTTLAAPDAGPQISIPSNISAQANSIVSIPVNFTSNGLSIANLAFSIDYDETWLSYDPSVPNAITFNLPTGTVGDCNVDNTRTDGEINCVILDPMVPLAAIPDGTFLSIKLRTLGASDGTVAPVNFASDPAPSFGDTDGQSEPGNGINGSVLFGDQNGFAFLPLVMKVFPTHTPEPPTETPEPPTETTEPPTDTPEPTPPPDCDEIIVNGDFEDTEDGDLDGYGWELEVTEYTASFSDIKVHSPERSLLTGIFDPNDNTYSWSSGNQIVTIPNSADDATLTFWNYPRSGESTVQRLSASIWARIVGITPDTALAFDMQYVAVKDLTAGTDATVIWWQISNSREWENVELDLSDYTGHEIQLWFTTFNDGYDGVSSMFIDDVSLLVCD
ncbi:cohesin domain-containing protein [Chloroflexota bacterium]